VGESQASDEQYLTGHGESPGRWYGAGASSLGLEGEASPSGFRRMFEGRDPDTGELLGRPHGRNANRVQGPEGRWTALGGRDLYRHRLAVDAIYRASYQASTFARQDVIAAIGGRLAAAAPYASSRAATSRAVPASMTRVLTSRARAAPTIALALSAPTEIPTTCGMRRIRSGVMPSSRGSSG
jgi:hypothetical protein